MAEDDTWSGDFASVEQRTLDSWLEATPSQRLAWLEEALAFAYRTGALKVAEPEIENVNPNA